MGLIKVLKTGVPKSAQVNMWVTLASTSITIIILSCAALTIWRRSKYTWLVSTLSMLIACDLFIIWANFGYILELDESYTVNHLISIELATSVATGIFNCLTNLFHWFFAFEYWYVSIETPNFLLSTHKPQNQKFYRVIKWLGVAGNVASCVILAYYEWVLEHAIYVSYKTNTALKQSAISDVVIMQYVVQIFILISMGFLADALRRFKRESTNRSDLVLNYRLMYVHISVVTLQITASLIIWTILSYIATKDNPVLYNAIAALLFILNFCIQITIAFIYVRIATP